MKTSARSQQLDLPMMGCGPSTSFAAASPVKTSVLPGGVLAFPESEAVYGASSVGSSRKFVHAMPLSKTLAAFDLKDWKKFSGNSLRSGMMRSGTVFPLQPLARLTVATGSGSWPTPQTRYDGRSNAAWVAAKERASKRHKSGQYGRGCGAPGMMDLKRAVRMAEGREDGELNPPWLEWLMGFPVGWTESLPLETPSSRKSRK